MHESEHITKKHAQGILNSFNYAEYLGKAFNVYCVIHLNDTINQACDTAFKAILTKFRRWLEYQRRIGNTDCRPYYAFTHENPDNNPHVNWCVHIAPDLQKDFFKKLRVWIEGVQGALEGHTLHAAAINPARYRTLSFYIIKGIDPEYVDYFNFRERYERKGPQGLIFGQRAGVSRALGRKAMKRDNFDPITYYRAKLKQNAVEKTTSQMRPNGKAHFNSKGLNLIKADGTDAFPI